MFSDFEIKTEEFIDHSLVPLYKDFEGTTLWKDIIGYLDETIEFNRDCLEYPSKSDEPDDIIRGRIRGLRDFKKYIEKMASVDGEQ